MERHKPQRVYYESEHAFVMRTPAYECGVDLWVSPVFQDINRKSTNVVESWGGTKEKQAYTHVIFKNATFTFTWAFQRTNQGQDVSFRPFLFEHRGDAPLWRCLQSDGSLRAYVDVKFT